MCCPSQSQKLNESDFLFGAPKFYKKFLKMVKILKIFIIRSRIAKFWGYIDFGALISYPLKNFGLGPPFGPHGAPKGQNFEIFVFEHRTFKIEYSTNFGALISYLLKNFRLGPPFGPQRPLKGQNFEIFVFERRTFKI